MLNIFRTDKNEHSSSHIRNLVAVALADGTLSEAEWQYISEIATEKGISLEELEEFRHSSHSAGFHAPTEFSDKLQQIFELIQVMMADGKIEDKELRICRKLAERLNVHPRIVNDMLIRMGQLYKENSPLSQVVDELIAASK